MNDKYIPINKGNYSMDTPKREADFEANRAHGWEDEYSDYRKKWSEYPKQQHVSDYPLLVDLELSSICNLRCAMCYTITDHFKAQVNTKRMDFDLFKKIIDEIGGNVPAIRLSLRGEATLHRNFAECIAYAKEKGIREVSTLTHGGKLTLPFFEKIADAGIDWITVSADGVGETYEKVRKPLKFSDLMGKLRDIKEYKEKHGLKRPVIKVQGIWPSFSENPKEYYDTFEPVTDLVAFNPLIDYLGNDQQQQISYIKNFACPQHYQRIVVGADGLVMQCSNDEENLEVIGDANTQSIHEIWHSETLNKIRALHMQEDGFLESKICRRCYLPRETRDEVAEIDGREFIVKNYTNRNQEIGT